MLRVGIHRASQGGPGHLHGTQNTCQECRFLGSPSPDEFRFTFRVLLHDYWDLPRAISHPGSESPVTSSLMWSNSLPFLPFFLQRTSEMKQQWT